MSETREMRIPTAEELFERLKNNPNLPKYPWKDWDISKEEWVGYVQGRIRQDIGAPKKGDIAPDFSVERLDGNGKRTGQKYFTTYSLYTSMVDSVVSVNYEFYRT